MAMETKPIDRVEATITLPGSKSFTHRALIAASLADGASTLYNPLQAEDTLLTAQALKQLGAQIDWQGHQCRVLGTAAVLKVPDNPIYLGDSGTSMRLLTALVALGQGRYRLLGSERLNQRPIQDLLDALTPLGVEAFCEAGNGCPPVAVNARGLAGQVSSQFLSAILLISPFAHKDVEVEVIGELVSRPYVDITLEVMSAFGIAYFRKNYQFFSIPAGQRYQARTYEIEGDASSASYFLGAAAITEGRVKITNLKAPSCQGDARFIQILEQMGCQIEQTPNGLVLQGRPLKGITVNMADMPDLVPTLAVVAAFAQGETTITGVAHLRHKESNRLQAVTTELTKIGIAARETPEGLAIQGGHPHGAAIETYNDHRIAMSFALAGLRVRGIIITNEGCVAKSFPEFWEYFDRLTATN
ncbi:MAG: 3-phosphoshikimate 1-carboxyvinyltransferase [Deltaproteobacteria bacterium]|nr:3-phosphoshikimate 1-carboxyvinyltransferase [Deltaproteobacteria bacterium]